MEQEYTLPTFGLESFTDTMPSVDLGRELTAVKALHKLRGVIAKEGVSKGDVQVLMSTVRSLRAAGIGLEHFGSNNLDTLEQFSKRAFTEYRTGFQQTASLEAFDQGIWATIKSWISKIIAFLKKMWTEFRNGKPESYFESLFERFVKAIRLTREATVVTIGSGDAMPYEIGFTFTAAAMLAQSGIGATRQQMAAFDSEIESEFMRLSTNAITDADLFTKTVTKFGLVDGEANTNRVLANSRGIEELRKVLEAAQLPAKFEYIKLDEVLANNSYSDRVFGYEEINASLKSLITAFERLDRSGADQRSGSVLAVIETISAIIGNLEFVGKFFYQTNIHKVKALDTLYRAATACYKITMAGEMAKAKVGDDSATTAVLNERHKKLADQVARLIK